MDCTFFIIKKMVGNTIPYVEEEKRFKGVIWLTLLLGARYNCRILIWELHQRAPWIFPSSLAFLERLLCSQAYVPSCLVAEVY